MGKTLAQNIEELKRYIQTLEQAIEQANIGAESYRDFVREIFTTAEQRAQVDYRRWRHADQHIDARLRDGRLTHDPRKDPEWREYIGYIPPHQKAAVAPAAPALG